MGFVPLKNVYQFLMDISQMQPSTQPIINPQMEARLAARAAARRARTPERRRQDWLDCPHCEGAGAFTTRANDPDAREYECSACDGTGEVNDLADWAEAVRLWNATPDTGDFEKYAAVEGAFGEDLANVLETMAEECGVVR